MNSVVDERLNPVGLIGIGTMGRGIAKLLLSKGYHVLAIELDDMVAQSSMARLKADLRRRLDKGKLTQDEHEDMMQRVDLVGDISDFFDAACVIECVSEEAEIKKEVFSRLEDHFSEEKIISTNTSSLSVNELAKELKHPERFLGIHFFNPPEAMPLVEIVRGDLTSNSTVSSAVSFVESLGKKPVVVPDIPGFYVNRILFPMIIEGIRVLEVSGSQPEDIDKAMRLGAGLPMGPLELSDFIGNDVVLGISRQLAARTGEIGYEPPGLLARLVSEGRLGRKSGKGFYEY